MNKILDNLRKMLIYLLIIVIVFYGSLILLSYDSNLNFFMLLFTIPIICLATSITYGIINKFNIAFSIIVAILFVPMVFCLGKTSLIYLVIYPLITCLGNIMGLLIRKIIGK